MFVSNAIVVLCYLTYSEHIIILRNIRLLIFYLPLLYVLVLKQYYVWYDPGAILGIEMQNQGSYA
jgi:hypothetical protein